MRCQWILAKLLSAPIETPFLLLNKGCSSDGDCFQPAALTEAALVSSCN